MTLGVWSPRGHPRGDRGLGGSAPRLGGATQRPRAARSVAAHTLAGEGARPRPLRERLGPRCSFACKYQPWVGLGGGPASRYPGARGPQRQGDTGSVFGN